MLVRLPPVFVLFSLSSLSVSSVKLRILENFTLYLRNSWSLNLRAIENCICGLRSIGRKMRSILRTVHGEGKEQGERVFTPLWNPIMYSPTEGTMLRDRSRERGYSLP